MPVLRPFLHACFIDLKFMGEIFPRVREYLAHEFKVDEAGVQKWAQHWHKAALGGLEEHLSSEKETGTYCQGEQITIADICLASQVAGANFFKVDLAPFPTVSRIAAACAKNDAFARAEEHTSELQSHRDLHSFLHDALPILPRQSGCGC